MNELKVIENLLSTIEQLRNPIGGCPWDLKQTHQSLKKYLIEETYEVAECLDQAVISYPELKDELGDVLLQILLHSQLSKEKAQFSFLDVCSNLNEKLIRRHPHVFSDQKAHTAEEVTEIWNETKKKEKPAKNSILEDIPHALPSLDRTIKILEKVTRVGFQWDNLIEPLNKIEEEFNEVKKEVLTENPQLEKVEAEIGDLLFTVCNIAFLMKVDPDRALKNMLKRFENRFNFIEKKIKDSGKKIEDTPLTKMDQYWNEAKKNE